MKQNLLNKVEEIINALACNEHQTIEVRGALNMAMQLRAELEVIDIKVLEKEPKEAPKEIVKEEPKEDTKKKKYFFEDEDDKAKDKE